MNANQLIMTHKVKVTCLQCGKTSYVISKGDDNEIIVFNCPYCGKSETLLAYTVDLGRRGSHQAG